ncbi:unnamed protein product [Adineta steineri]|uniref:F-box domain-containing protein n=1 Tax=Adineta steineri TaxID=433720 RepID=A0A819BQ86_9BILA|nr:unnamed protein product [Adineta steineri]CAF3795576.1 unnamed protein product [Adineta steineri]
MDQIKRQRNNSVNIYDNNKKQKIQVDTNFLSKEVTTCFEDLSNELIYEIFELLDCDHVYQAFYSLNTRFYNLITNSTLPIEVNLSSISKSIFQRYNQDIILPNKHKIHSLHLSNPCLYDDISSPIHILPEFLYLKTLSLNDIESECLEYLVPTLVSLPCLSSLSISSADNVQNKNSIYSQTIRLASLKYCSLSLKGSDNNELSLPTWEQLILSHMPKLRIFDVRHEDLPRDITTENHNDNQVVLNNPTDKFTSSFWSERQWFFIQQFVHEAYGNCTTFYSTNPYRRKYYILGEEIHPSTSLNSKKSHLQSVRHLQIDDANETIDCKYYFPNVTTLTLGYGFSRTRKLIASNLNHIIPLKQLTKLVIKSRYLSLTKLIEVLRFTPHIRTLIFESILLYRVNYNSIQQNETFQLVSNTNMITNVTLKQTCNLDKIQLLVALFPRIQHLTIDHDMKDLKSTVRFLLKKTNQNTSQLCSIRLLSTRESWLTRLRTFIESETLITDYKLKKINTDIHLWW